MRSMDTNDYSDPIATYQREAARTAGPADRYGTRVSLSDALIAAHFIGRGLALCAMELRRIANALEERT